MNEIQRKYLLRPVNMLNLYAQGAFPMADDNGEIDWYQPKERCVILINDYNIPRSLRKFMEKSDFEYRLDYNILDVIKHCADRKETWISESLIEAYKGLIELRYLHSVSVFQENKLVGGLYGVAIGGAFFGESMFSKISQASKSALAFLLKHMEQKGYIFLDVQYQTDHLKMFGTIEIDFYKFNDLLDEAYDHDINFI